MNKLFRKLRLFVALIPVLVLPACMPSHAFAAPLDQLEIKTLENPAPACQFPNAQGAMMPMPCAFMFAMMQKMMGGGCGERTCPIRL